MSEPAAGLQGSPISEPGLQGRQDILFFEDFEQKNWRRHWRAPNGKPTITEDRDQVFHGRRALEIRCAAGQHKTNGWNREVLSKGLAKVHVRAYYYFPERFVIKPCNGIKLFAVGASPRERKPDGYPIWKSSVVPNGTDFYNTMLTVSNRWGLKFYFYNPEQRGQYGASQSCNQVAPGKLKVGRWQCIELMCQANDPGQKNGVIQAWIDGTLCGKVEGIRFRDVENVVLREMALVNYFGGAGAKNTSPQDQTYFIDNVVIAREYIGPAVFKRPKPKKRRAANSIAVRPKPKPDPLAAHKEALAPVRAFAAKGAFDEAVKALPSEIKDDPALAAFASGIRAGARLKKQIIAGAKAKRPAIYIDFGGRTTRAKLISADAAGIAVRMSGSELPLKWSLLSPARFYGIAAKFTADTPAGHGLLAQYCAAMGLKEKARAEIQKSGAGTDLAALLTLVR